MDHPLQSQAELTARVTALEERVTELEVEADSKNTAVANDLMDLAGAVERLEMVLKTYLGGDK